MYQFANKERIYIYTAFINKIQSVKTLWCSVETPMFCKQHADDFSIFRIFLFVVGQISKVCPEGVSERSQGHLNQKSIKI